MGTLTKERVNGGKSREQLWGKILAWHKAQYAKEDNPAELPYADQSLEVLEAAEKEMGLWHPLDINVIQKLVEEPEAPPVVPAKRSLFARLKEGT